MPPHSHPETLRSFFSVHTPNQALPFYQFRDFPTEHLSFKNHPRSSIKSVNSCLLPRKQHYVESKARNSTAWLRTFCILGRFIKTLFCILSTFNDCIQRKNWFLEIFSLMYLFSIFIFFYSACSSSFLLLLIIFLLMQDHPYKNNFYRSKLFPKWSF